MSENPLPDAQILPATARDYKEVMSISKGIYCGADPLPSRYHEWLADPKREMFVAKSEGKVVGFMSFLLVDDGTTAVAEALRVAPWMRGRGIAGAIQQFSLDFLRSNYPGATRIRFSGTSETPPTIMSRCRKVHSKSLISVVIPYEQMEEKIKLLEGRLEGVGGRRLPVALSPSEVLRLFEDPCTTERLLPKGLLIQSWFPLSTHRSNLELLRQRGVVWLYSQPSASISEICTGTHDSPYTPQEPSAPIPLSLPISSSLPNPSIVSHTSCGFLSLGTPPFPVPLGDGMCRFDIDLFGTDPVSAQSHVLHQLIEMQRVLPAGGGAVCYLFAETSLFPELNQFCQGLEPFYKVIEQHVLEIEV
ncbi:hypothetical protein XENTR_v10010164 [Xenopus tropicalis]|nr:hypothetical protein XENTR_v10010164 [Xenopus tropicalis]|eukprot:XP_002941245.1 PREDICTED: probable N-acetyltransferase 16 [Xenopus tropicalis]